MKKQHLFIVYALCLLLAVPAAAVQETKSDRATVQFSDPSRPGLLKASTHNGSITVKGTSRKDVSVEAQTQTRSLSKRSSEKEGMKMIRLSSTGLEIEEKNNIMSIEVSSMQKTVDLVIEVPLNTSLMLDGHNGGQITVENIQGDIEVDHHNGPLSLTGISGSIIAHTFNGEVRVVFDRIEPDKPMSFSTYNGDIDVTFPPAIKATAVLKTEQGDVLSDFNLVLETKPIKQQKDEREKGGKFKISFDENIYGKINGGGPEYRFETHNGDIILRRSK